ncbi:uncharacterized protein N7473_008651 [Penicillium subrubescens]|uniref:C-factor n=1 Tax=Penicillium subrubescens TaxID=1316194 RepID=A0A1Q5U082_9EURO|nr:uncharacterized protein N7473_008651 [Penicillium subrubescens]KAJ5885977.1 hypothetical protein N7473_008651 [Penicillium subrubescens]OKP05883.1 hypothetical protein PENSUB_6603 [Penicillium subrubescens]
MASYLVTGSSRGLGLALVSRLASLPSAQVGKIIATARQDNSPQLTELVNTSSGRVELVKLDVTNKSSIQEAAKLVEGKLQGKGLDYLINNAGLMDWSSTGLEGMDNLNDIFHTNVTSVHNVTQAFLPLLRKGEKKVVINISTTLGSFAKAEVYRQSPTPAYKISKAALNMLTVQYAQQYEAEGFTLLAISPGWLRTDLGSARADLPVETGAEKVLDIVQQTGPHQNGKFLNIHVPGWENASGNNQYDGEEVAW